MLSLGGRITMINAVLLAILMFFLSFFPILRWVEKNINSLRSFVEGRKKMAKLLSQLEKGVQAKRVWKFRGHQFMGFQYGITSYVVVEAV